MSNLMYKIPGNKPYQGTQLHQTNPNTREIVGKQSIFSNNLVSVEYSYIKPTIDNKVSLTLKSTTLVREAMQQIAPKPNIELKTTYRNFMDYVVYAFMSFEESIKKSKDDSLKKNELYAQIRKKLLIKNLDSKFIDTCNRIRKEQMIQTAEFLVSKYIMQIDKLVE